LAQLIEAEQGRGAAELCAHMGAVNADVWRRLTWVEPSWFENDWGADQRQQGDPKHTISREELGFEGRSVEYCGLYVGPPDSQREPEWEWKPESRNRKSAKVVASSWRGQLWPTILKNQRFRRITEFSLPTAAAIAMPALLQLPPSLHAAMNFTPSQRNAINHTPGSLQPIVCAGSGKMEVVGPAHGHAHNADQHSQPDQRRLGALVTVLGWLRFFRLDLQN
jgi:hypothetical protein